MKKKPVVGLRFQSWFLARLPIIIGMLLIGVSNGYAVPVTLNANCGLGNTETSNTSIFFPSPTFVPTNQLAFLSINSTNLLVGTTSGTAFKICLFSSLPDEIDSDCDSSKAEVDGQTNYIALIHIDNEPKLEYCLYQYDVNTANVADVRKNGAVVTMATSFAALTYGIIGLFIVVLGLMWFGKRRKKTP